MICQGQANHGLANRNNTWNGGNVMASAHPYLDWFVIQVQGVLLDAYGGDGLDRHPGNYYIAVCQAGKDAPGIICSVPLWRNGIIIFRTEQLRRPESGTDFNSFDCSE